jgi:DnaJ-like protein
MYIPIARRYTARASATVDGRFRCAHCGFEAHAIARGLGKGTGISPFFIDLEGAKVDARVKAVFVAREHARFTLDIVPCPRCNKRGERAQRKFKNNTALVLFGSIVLGVGLAGLVSATMTAPLVGLLVGVFAAGLVILVDTVTRKANWNGATKRVTFEEPGSERAKAPRPSRQSGAERGQDVRVAAELSLANAMAGGKVDILVNGKVPCSSCSGTGVWIGDQCTACSGGTLDRQRRVLVTFPAGIDSGHRLRVAGMGMPGLDNAPSGDLYVDVEVAAEGRFERRGDDLETRVRISFTTAALGGNVSIELPDASVVNAAILSGTEAGARLIVAGQGMPRLGRSGRGDLHVAVDVGE